MAQTSTTSSSPAVTAAIDSYRSLLTVLKYEVLRRVVRYTLIGTKLDNRLLNLRNDASSSTAAITRVEESVHPSSFLAHVH